MPGLMGVVGDGPLESRRLSAARWTLDLLGRGRPEEAVRDEAYLACVPLRAESALASLHEDARFLAGAVGDFAGASELSWERIATDLARDSEAWLGDLDGPFAVAVYDQQRRRLRLYADHYGCRPLFWARDGRRFLFSTALPTFVQLMSGLSLDREWFMRFLYFGYWPGQPTFLAGVRRLTAGQRLTYDLASGELAVEPYEPRHARREPPLRGGAALDQALEVFQRRVPTYFGRDRRLVVALSGGLDTRTLLAFMPDGLDYRTFTYGAPGCPDQLEADRVVRRMGYPHRRLYFDAAYEPSLPGLIHEVVWLSGGLAWINRAMLPAVYRFVAEDAVRPPYLMSGIGLDTLYRGHNNARGDLNRFLGTGEIGFTDPGHAAVMGTLLKEYQDVNRAAGEELQREHGAMSRSDAYLSYLVYTLVPSYFSADLEAGGNYAVLRVPGWDREITRLAWEIEYSTIYNSKYIPHSRHQEFILQTHLMRTHRRLARVPLHGMPLWAYAPNRGAAYRALRLLHHGPRYLKRRFLPTLAERPLEDWNRWYATVLAEELRAILAPHCLVRAHVGAQAIPRLFETRGWAFLARLASVELLLRLIDNGWRLENLPFAGAAQAASWHAGSAGGNARRGGPS